MTQYTQKFVKRKFEILLEETGNTGPAFDADKKKFRVGAWTLDYAACYGGWIIEEVVNEGGAVRHVNDWTNRMKAKEIVSWMDGFVIGLSRGRAIEAATVRRKRK